MVPRARPAARHQVTGFPWSSRGLAKVYAKCSFGRTAVSFRTSSVSRLAISVLLVLFFTSCNQYSSSPPPPASPVANPGGPYSGNVGQTISFDGSKSTAPSGQTLTYSWSFGDNATLTGVSPTHAYSTVGTFTVSLTVTDTSGATNTATTTATIAALPVANAGGPYTGNVGQTITFDGSKSTAPSGQTLTYSWSFGDNATLTGVSPTHAYSTVGTFTVSLTVTDTSGATNTATTTATIAALPVANAGGPYTGNVGQTITFDGSKSTAPSGQTLTYAWNFGDNSTGTGVSPTHAYSTVGTFTVSLTVADTSAGTNTATTTATIAALPVANAGGPYTGNVGQAIAFDGSKSTAPSGQTLTYAWNFGDNSTGMGVSPTHAYSTVGTFTVSLTVTDTAGATNTATATATISSGVAPSISSFAPTSGPVGTQVTITGSNLSPAPQVTLVQQGGGSIGASVVSASASSIGFVVPAGAATGPLTVTVGGQSATSSTSFTVLASASFTVNAAPSTANLVQGQSVSYSVSLSSTNGFAQLAALSVTGLPTGISASFNPSQITAGQSSMLTVIAPAGQAAGSSTLTVMAAATVQGIPLSSTASVTLSVQGVSTSFLGRTVVDDSRETPIAGVSIKFLGVDDKGNATGCAGQTVSDSGGNFLLSNLASACVGPQLISYDGSTATSPPGKYAGVNLSYTLVAGQVTTSPVLVHLPRIDNAETVNVQQNAPVDQVFTFQTIPSLQVTVYAGTTFSLDDGSQPNPFPLVAISIPIDRLPDMMPSSGMLTPFIVAFQPANAVASQPVAVNFPNPLNVASGTAATFMTLDPAHGYMVPYGTGTVSPDGTQFIPDPDPAHPGHSYGLVHFDWHGPAVPPPNRRPPGPCGSPDAGNSVDLSSGVEVVRTADIGIEGGRQPIVINRVYVSSNTNAGPFGIGTNHNYGYVLDVSSLVRGIAMFATLDLPDGNQYYFAKSGNGTFTNSMFPNCAGAVITIPSPNVYNLRWNDGTMFTFQPSAQGPITAFLNSVQDPNGNRITLVHGNSNEPALVTQVVDTVGRSLNFTYDGSNRITSISDPIGRSVSYSYNAQGTLATFTDAMGGVTSYVYDSNNQLTQITDARGVVVSQDTYDASGRVIQEVEADGGTLKFSYPVLLNPLIPVSPILLTAITDALGNQTIYRFDPSQFLSDVTDASGQTTHFTRAPQQNNHITAITGSATCAVCGDPTQGNSTFTYDANGNLLTQTDSLGNTTTYTYDPAFNRITSITNALGNAVVLTYDTRGNVVSLTGPNGNKYTFAYDTFGQLVQMVDPLGATTAIAYDAFGNRTSVTDPQGNTSRAIYDAVGRPIEFVDALGREAQVAADNLDRLVSETDALGKTTSFTWDAIGDLLKITDAGGNITSFAYDAVGREIKRTTPLGATITAQYDLAGNRISLTDARGQTRQFAYDPLNRPIQETYQDSTVKRFYDANGRTIHVVDSIAGVFDFGYDSTGRLLSSSNQFGTVTYAYNGLGLVTNRQVAGQPTVQYRYDPDNNLLSATAPQASVNFNYSANDFLLGATRGNGANSTFTYDSNSRLLSLTHQNGSSTLDAQTYSYDATGKRVSSIRNIAQGLITQALQNQYNAGNQLTQTTGSAGATANVDDANGNLISSTGPNGTTTFTWDSRNRLQSISTSAGQKTTFVYDFANNLISETQAGPQANLTSNFLIDDMTNVAGIIQSNGDDLSVLSGRSIDQHLAIVHSTGAVEYMLTDAINSTVAVTDQSGSVTRTFSYEPFGQTTPSGAGAVFEFTGRMPVTPNLYSYRSRYYDQVAGRFLSEDYAEIGSGENLYVYADSDPISQRDPTGMQAADAPLNLTPQNPLPEPKPDWLPQKTPPPAPDPKKPKNFCPPPPLDQLYDDKPWKKLGPINLNKPTPQFPAKPPKWWNNLGANFSGTF